MGFTFILRSKPGPSRVSPIWFIFKTLLLRLIIHLVLTNQVFVFISLCFIGVPTHWLLMSLIFHQFHSDPVLSTHFWTFYHCFYFEWVKFCPFLGFATLKKALNHPPQPSTECTQPPDRHSTINGMHPRVHSRAELWKM